MVESIYIHIPFCKNICSYCDFCKNFYNEKIVNKYLLELKKEIFDNYNNEKIKTLYIGGGTPSCLTIEQLNDLFSLLKDIDKTLLEEYTIEVNIDDINEEKLILFKNNGINRLSIGVESFNKKLLKIMNRNIDDDIFKKIELAKEYFDNINIDLIYGFKEEDIDILSRDLDIINNLDIKHVSTYSLIVEEHTKLFNDKYVRLDDDVDAEYYNLIIKFLEEHGFKHYEISNFAKPGYESKHNLCYWNNNRYYGFGLGAGGYKDNIRYTNTRSIDKYLNGERKSFVEEIDKKSDMEYEMILGLRKVNGVSKNEFFNKFNCNISDVFDIIELEEKGLLIEDNENIYIPKDKLYIENGILTNFVGGSKNEK